MKNTLQENMRRFGTKNLSEQDIPYAGGGPDSKINLTPSKVKTSTNRGELTMGSNLFANGVDTIDKNSKEFKNGLNSITRALQQNKTVPLNITVTGGASSVGSNKGYDNPALAKRRASNFIAAVKESLPANLYNQIKFTVKTIVGGATEKNSTEANQQQFVRISDPAGMITATNTYTTARDATSTGANTNLDITQKQEPIPTDMENNPYMIVKFYYEDGVNKEEIKDKIFKITGSPVRELENYKQAANLRFKYK